MPIPYVVYDLTNEQFQQVGLSKTNNTLTAIHLDDLTIFMNSNDKNWMIMKRIINGDFKYKFSFRKHLGRASAPMFLQIVYVKIT